MSNHTKGPWIVGDGKLAIYVHVLNPFKMIAWVEAGQVENAQLIAASPDMLEALQAAKALLEAQGINKESRIGGEQFLKVQNAINKALGNG